ncbi:DNA-binding protein MutS2 [uncultured archaeon]|nr:DNA-binding protein MutS2 [uncultured archaeon]
MKEELLNFISENNLSPFNKQRTPVKNGSESIFKTRDGKSVHNRVLIKISNNFVFPDTGNLLNFFSFTESLEEIKQRQVFFNELKKSINFDNSFLNFLLPLKQTWKPKYDVLVVTENSQTFMRLKEAGCPVRLLISESDISLLESYDLIQIINCDEFSRALESLPQAVFLKSVEEVYLERHLEKLSSWKANLEILRKGPISEELNELVQELSSLLDLTSESESEEITRDSVELAVDKINERVSDRLKDMMVSGDSLIAMISKQILPPPIKSIVQEEVRKSNIPLEVLNLGIPVSIDEPELEKFLQRKNSSEYFDSAQKIKNNSFRIKEIPRKLQELSDFLILFDFLSGTSKFVKDKTNFPLLSEELLIKNSKNIFLDHPRDISFELNDVYRCSILTGANSGGKTTLLEHVLQLVSLAQLGFPISGEAKIPLFTDVYYFAKNKGSESKGAFETLLTQMSKIKPGAKTLILADEIESVTEPGVAGEIIAATAEFFLKQNCFLIVATHLGYEIQKNLPILTRIDGIEAKGLDEGFNLIVDHNPVLGRLAHSTPELIVEKLANSEKTDYFIFLNSHLKNNKK